MWQRGARKKGGGGFTTKQVREYLMPTCKIIHMYAYIFFKGLRYILKHFVNQHFFHTAHIFSIPRDHKARS